MQNQQNESVPILIFPPAVVGYVISEANRLSGVWLLARCADLEGLMYDVTEFHLCLGMLLAIGLVFRLAAVIALFTLHQSKQK